MAIKLLLSIFLSLLFFSVAIGQRTTGLSDAQQCRLQRITASQPSQRIESEGGVTELWDENEDQFQCAGVAPMRNTIRPNALSLPNYHPSPRLVFVEQGEGILGLSIPGCAETYHSSRSSSSTQEESQEEEKQQQEGRRSTRRDQHQKVHRIRRGDILTIPAGVAHWCFNDGNEELVAFSVTDLNNQANQLDQKLRAFYLAGGPKKGQQGEHGSQPFQNFFRAFDEQLIAESFNIPVELVRRLQKEDDRGFIVNVREGMRVIRPDEEQEEEGREQWGNGLEETMCTVKVRTSINNRREADVYSRQAGRLNIVNKNKLSILTLLDMSAERGSLRPGALFTPHWSVNGHDIKYVTRGDAQVQIVGPNGQAVMNDRVKQGELFVVPQYFTSTFKAGGNGFEWVSIKTTSSPLKSPLAGYTSVFRALPLQVITNSYQVSPKEAQDLKLNRGGETFLLSPGRRQ